MHESVKRIINLTSSESIKDAIIEKTHFMKSL